MGFIAKLKNLFNKNIECGIEGDNHIVFPLKKKKYLYVKKNIVVRDNSSCVIVCRGKVTDVLNPGKYKINSENLPETFARAKMHKRKGFGAKKIRADIYYVNKREFKDFYFLSDSPFVSKSYEMGKVKGCMQGTCTLKVIDSEQLMRNILAKFNKPKIKGINNLIALWVGNNVNKKIKKLKISANELLTNAESLEGLLNRELEDAYDKKGLFVKNVKLKSVNFSRRYQKRVGEYMAKHRKFVKTTISNDSLPSIPSASLNKIEIKENVLVQTNAKSEPVPSNTVKRQAPALEYKKCDRCGAKNDISSKICKYCGKNF